MFAMPQRRDHRAVPFLAPDSDAAARRPSYFFRGEVKDAKSEADSTGKLLVIFGTAAWHPPCLRMEREASADDAVSSWLQNHAVVVAVDVDASPAVASSLVIQTVPDLCVFRGDKRLSNAREAMDAPALHAWLVGVVSEDAGGLDGTSGIDVRYHAARRLLADGAYERATDEYEWLWLNVLEHAEGYGGVRGSYMLSEICELIDRFPPAKERFMAIRDGLERRLTDGDASRDDLDDWIQLTYRAFGESDRVLAWVDRVRGVPSGREAMRFSSDVRKLLIAAGRWDVLGEIVADAEAEVDQHVRLLRMSHERAPRGATGIGAGKADERRETERRTFRARLSELHAGLLAAGRDSEAWIPVEALLAELDDIESRVVFVDYLERSGQARERHLALFDERDPAHAGLVARVRALLA